VILVSNVITFRPQIITKDKNTSFGMYEILGNVKSPRESQDSSQLTVKEIDMIAVNI